MDKVIAHRGGNILHFITMASQSSESTVSNDEPVKPRVSAPDMSGLPPIFLLAAHLDMEELYALEDTLQAANAPLTYDPTEAHLFIGKVAQKRRAMIELRGKGLVIEEITDRAEFLEIVSRTMAAVKEPATAGLEDAVIGDLSMSLIKPEPDSKPVQLGKRKRGEQNTIANQDPNAVMSSNDDGIVQVIKLSWLEDSIAATELLDIKDYVVYLSLIHI